jgi:hypothetical protein
MPPMPLPGRTAPVPGGNPDDVPIPLLFGLISSNYFYLKLLGAEIKFLKLLNFFKKQLQYRTS